MKYSILILLGIMISCFEEDVRVPPYPGEVFTVSDSIQTHTIFFDLETAAEISKYDHEKWELGFECGIEGWHVITNSGADWFIYHTNGLSIDDNPSMPSGLWNKYDRLNGWPDSTAVGEWLIHENDSVYSRREIYLLGKYKGGIFTDIRQIRFIEVTDTSYRFEWRNYDGKPDTVYIQKNNTRNFVYYSFKSAENIDIEPPKTAYDLTFESYYDMATLFGQTMPYKVGGVLLNPSETWVAIDSTIPYELVNTDVLPQLHFIKNRNVPGYDWKTVTVDITGGGSATYAVKSDITYIIKTQEQNFFKLRFLSYTLDGQSGFPRFEYAPLE